MKKQTEQPKKRTPAQKRVLKCLEETHGVVTSACKKAKIGRTQFYKWCNSDEGFKKEVDEIQDATLDFVVTSPPVKTTPPLALASSKSRVIRPWWPALTTRQ